jgi:hypothetical protein
LESHYRPLIIHLRLARRGESFLTLAARSAIHDLYSVPEFAALKLGAAGLAEVIARCISSEKMAFLLDGLNEIPASVSADAITTIETAFEEYSWNRFVITNRTTHTHLLGSLSLASAQVVYHRGVTAAAAETHIRGTTSLSEAAKKTLLGVLESGGPAAALLLNPQKLQLACDFFVQTGRLPSSSAELFSLELRTHLNATVLRAVVPPDVHCEFLAALAAEMTSRAVYVADLSGAAGDAALQMASVLEAVPADSAIRRWRRGELADGAFIDFLKTLESPFITLDQGLVAFIHESYQGFFAAQWLYSYTSLLTDADITRLSRTGSWQEAFAFLVCLPLSESGVTRLAQCVARTDDGVFLLARAFISHARAESVSGPAHHRRAASGNCHT